MQPVMVAQYMRHWTNLATHRKTYQTTTVPHAKISTAAPLPDVIPKLSEDAHNHTLPVDACVPKDFSKAGRLPRGSNEQVIPMLSGQRGTSLSTSAR